MTKKLQLNLMVDTGPTCYANFYHYVQSHFKGLAHIPELSAFLDVEPCKVKLGSEEYLIKGSDITDKKVTYKGTKWYLEFDTEDDYTIFMLRWS